MIKNPKFGWCEFKLWDFNGNPSYMTDVPIDLMECFISYFKTGQGMAWFDEEGSEFTLVLTPYSTYLIEDKEEAVLHVIELPVDEMAKELLEDLNKDSSEWLSWLPRFESLSDEEKQKRKRKFGELYDELGTFVKEWDYEIK
jgi:hypothetical protein